jgi:probable aminopeptidase NPEPL1
VAAPGEVQRDCGAYEAPSDHDNLCIQRHGAPRNAGRDRLGEIAGTATQEYTVPMPAHLVATTNPAHLAAIDSLLFLGRQDRLLEEDVLKLVPPSVGEAVYRQMVKKTDAGDSGRLATTWSAGSPTRTHVGVLPEPCSRHNSPSRAWAIPGLVGSVTSGNVGIVLCLDDPSHAPSALLAVARALPTFVASSQQVEREVRVLLLPRGQSAQDRELGLGPRHLDSTRLLIAAEAVRRAAHETDEPPAVLGCNEFVARAEREASRLGVPCRVLRADRLREEGLGGLLAVGQAAQEQPALVLLEHSPPGATRTVGWVGKGIVYDTGGLSIKQKTSMPSMKTDMAGAAAVLHAFSAAVRLGMTDRLVAALCIAENAVGPASVRPDDIITLYSGRTVEINNTDAEGRLVLSDGLCWVARNYRPDLLVDLATLTGAQAVATGKRHAALYCTDEELEQRAIRAGRHCGELVHPLPYAPELFRHEYRSAVADMRNSVKDRSNAQSSCAAQFMGNHLQAVGYEAPWLHVDMAAPAVSSTGRGTGYGVGLLLALEDLL